MQICGIILHDLSEDVNKDVNKQRYTGNSRDRLGSKEMLVKILAWRLELGSNIRDSASGRPVADMSSTFL